MTKARENSDYTGLAADIVAGDTAARSGRKNFIINGGFDVWQRGTTGAQANSGFVADRWKGNNYTTGTLTFSQRTDATGQTFRTYGRLAQSSAGSNNSTQGIMQWIEGLHLVGKTITVSFKVRGNAALSGCKVRGIIAQQTFNLTTDWVKHSFTGTAIQDGSNTRLMFDWGLENTTWHVDIAEVQVEVGSGTDFEHRSYGEELALCQRYFYQHIKGRSIIGLAALYTANLALGYVNFPVTMRAAPTGFSAVGTNYYVCYAGGVGPSFNEIGEFSDATTTGIRSVITLNTNGTAGFCGSLQTGHANADISFSAEL